MKLIIAEKKDQAKRLAAPFPTKAEGFGYIEVLPCPTFPKGAYFAWAAGHLVSLKEPEDYDPKFKEWKLEHLPILPEQFKLKPAKGKERLFTHLKKLIQNKSFTEIINACDPGREGEAIFTLIYQLSGSTKPVKRLWTSSLTKDAVTAAFQKLLPESEKKNLFYEAFARSCADWLVGMNTSRAYSILLREKGIKGEGFSTGRVQTPVLALIVEREEAIETFVSTPFWEVVAEFNFGGRKYTGRWFAGDHNRLTDRTKAEKLASWCSGKAASIEEIVVEDKEIKAPHFYSLSALQTLANKLYKLSPQEVLAACQSLYDEGYQSYPRTDSEYITEEEAKQFPTFLDEISKLGPYAHLFPTPIQSVIGNKRYVDPSKVSDHYAIIPTETIPELNSLSENERLIYDLVVKSVIAAHYETAIFQHTTILTYIGDQFSFSTKGKRLIREGWHKVMQIEDPDEKKEADPMIPDVRKGEEGITSSCEAKEGWTSAPKRLTQGDLIPLMKSAGSTLGDKELESIMRKTHGLGTEATRAGIIKRLKDQGYIEIRKNLVYPTTKGRTLIKAIGLSALSSAVLTAKWEQKLSEIGDGRYTHTSFIDQARKLATKLVTDAGESVRMMDLKTVVPILPPAISTIEKSIEGGSLQSEHSSGNGRLETNGESALSNPSNNSNTTPVSPPVNQYPAQVGVDNKINHDLFDAAVKFVIESSQASVSMLQQKLGQNYTLCARIIDQMEREGIISAYAGNTPRQVLMTMDQFRANSGQKALSKPTLTTDKKAPTETTTAHRSSQSYAESEKKLSPVEGPGSEYAGPNVPEENHRPIRQIAAEQDLGPCKKCGRPVIDKGVLYGCSAWEDTRCDFKISKTIKGVVIQREIIKRLLEKGSSGLIRGFIQKSKDPNKPDSTFDAVLVFDKEGKLCWTYPSLDVLKLPTYLLKVPTVAPPSEQEQKREFTEIEKEAATLKLPSKVLRATYGPRATRYELAPEPGLNVANFKRYKANFQLALRAETIIIDAPIPGKNVVGIEIPSKTPYTVNLRSLLENKEFLASKKALSFPLGMDMSGEPVYADLAEMPHLLVAGATGSGKSVFLNELIVSLLYGQTPDKLKFLFIDPKMVELSVYETIPHLFGPIVTDVRRAGIALKKLVIEMEKRYEILRNYGVRNIHSYNDKTRNDPNAPGMPYIVLVIDELADLMMTTGPEVEDCIQRLAQLARAAGIHMVIATQRPSKTVLSPVIKANLPVRISFAVANHHDSQVILDAPGAEALLGKGDMYYLPKDGAKRRLVSAYVSDEEIERVTNHITNSTTSAASASR
ncbi:MULTISPECIES: DNA topoisomerase 3 [unclassified Paenibacillus]|uniref:DNA topoisomerase 3 n=1 Tax=Paenibacillus provencensis TaxID=441151 RepID=A0ABW3Q0W6_9BACL|nr:MULTISPECIES: DNA topoisomerase 3 [unclassified Paenibacillus]MCM3130635.1 DNA topoisomerase 3 [Paenibacillus sp. MER 78]SDX73950.1 DNA topoisomerase-3 [Paenibacillus sp. PDC88]SFS89549.1 DNA topoisomerase III [Paenibacillus sp. 453mf]